MKRTSSLALCLMILFSVVPFTAYAQKSEQKVVRVGWYESTYCYRDQFGERRGAAYEYQRRIAAHTGWTYEYVEDNWPNLLQMLIDGEIDLLSDVSYKPEREEQMLYPALAMGSESYYIFIDADNTEINPEDLQTLSGQRVGVNKGSYQMSLLQDWMEKNHISLEIVELTGDEADSMRMLSKGEMDAFVSLDSFAAQERLLPVTKIGSSDYYFTVNKNRPDLLTELNSAMSAIQDEDPYFNQRMFDENVRLVKTNAFLMPSLENWLADHGTIRVGYWENYLPFCAEDKQTGELTGALKDFLVRASNCLKNADVQFKAIPYPSTAAAIQAMKNGEIDCVFPLYLSTYNSETMDILMINSIMKTDMSALMREEGRPEITPGKKLTVAIDEGNINFETLIRDEIPDWTIKTCPTMEDCFRAAASGEADGVLACNYRMGDYEPFRTKYKLVALPTGETMNLSFAINADSPELYSILNKIANLSPSEDMEYALVAYMYANQKVPFLDFLGDNWRGVLLFVTAVFAAILFLLYQKLKAERRVNAQQRVIEEGLRRELRQKEELKSVTQIAYTDALTGVKSKHAYLEAEERLDQGIADHTVTEFAMVLFDLNNLKGINDNLGHEIGDRYIKEACSIICKRFQHSPVYRIGGDEFVAVLEGSDYDNRRALLAAFEKQMDAHLAQGKIAVASGCATFDPSVDRSAHSVLEQADSKMYQRKKRMKESCDPIGAGEIRG